MEEFCDDHPLKPIVDNLKSVGTATVIATHNGSHRDGITSPSCISSAISVGSYSDSFNNTTFFQNISTQPGGYEILANIYYHFIDNHGFDMYNDFHLAEYSNHLDSMTDIIAPGTRISSSVPGGGFESKSGTSMATPHIAGAIAVIRSIDSDITVDEILNLLQTTGTSDLVDFGFEGVVTITDSWVNPILTPRVNLRAAADTFPAPILSSSSYIIDFGEVEITDLTSEYYSDAISVILENTGDVNLNINSNEIFDLDEFSAPVVRPEFHFAGEGFPGSFPTPLYRYCSENLILEPGESCTTFPIYYQPVDEGNDNDNRNYLKITYNGGRSVRIVLNGQTPTEATDPFDIIIPDIFEDIDLDEIIDLGIDVPLPVWP